MIDDVADGHRLHVPFELAGLDLGEVEDVVDQLGETFAFADDDLEVVVHLLDGLDDLAIVLRHEREDAVFEALPMILANPSTDVSGVRSSWLTVERNELFAASASTASARAFSATSNSRRISCSCSFSCR